jgi:DNA-binding transcriptional ArsR family regulator/cytochrome c553
MAQRCCCNDEAALCIRAVLSDQTTRLTPSALPKHGHRRHLKDACEACGFVPQHDRQLEIHHVDQNRSNNDAANLQTLCSNCHSLAHGTAQKRSPLSGEQALILAQLRALKAQRRAAEMEERHRRGEMRDQLRALVQAGQRSGLQVDDMYRTAGISRSASRRPRGDAPAQVRSSSEAGATSTVGTVDAKLVNQLKALADPARIAIIDRLSRLDESPVEQFRDELQLSQPTISHHLKALRRAGLVEVARTSGTWTYYRLVPERLSALASTIAAFGRERASSAA